MRGTPHSRVWWCIWLRIRHCLCSAWGHCFGLGSIPGPGNLHMPWAWSKQKQKQTKCSFLELNIPRYGSSPIYYPFIRRWSLPFCRWGDWGPEEVSREGPLHPPICSSKAGPSPVLPATRAGLGSGSEPDCQQWGGRGCYMKGIVL